MSKANCWKLIILNASATSLQVGLPEWYLNQWSQTSIMLSSDGHCWHLFKTFSSTPMAFPNWYQCGVISDFIWISRQSKLSKLSICNEYKFCNDYNEESLYLPGLILTRMTLRFWGVLHFRRQCLMAYFCVLNAATITKLEHTSIYCIRLLLKS